MANVLKHFLEPQKIAIFGVFKAHDRPGHLTLRNLREFGYAGEVYPVSPEGGEVLGFKTYRSIEELPEHIDLAICMLSAEKTIESLDNYAQKGIRNVLLVSGGFSESGHKGAERQSEVVRFARQRGIRLMGPNAVGPVNASNNLVLPFYPIDHIKKGSVSFIAQSGQFCCPVMEFIMSSLNLGLSKSIDLGNCCDVNEADVMEYLEEDPDTKVIAIYMESIREGKRFLEVAKRVSRKKPIVVFKTGRTDDGQKTASSHTGAIAVDDTVFDAALKQSGVTRAGDLDGFHDSIKIFDHPYIPKGNRVAVVTYSGGIGSMVADVCGESGLKLAQLSNETIDKIRPALLPSAKISNPLDSFAVGIPKDINAVYGVPLNAFMEDPNVDMVLSCFMVNRWVWSMDFKQILEDLKNSHTKPMAAWVIGEDRLVRESATILEEGGIPVFPSPERAVKALGTLWGHYSVLAER